MHEAETVDQIKKAVGILGLTNVKNHRTASAVTTNLPVTNAHSMNASLEKGVVEGYLAQEGVTPILKENT